MAEFTAFDKPTTCPFCGLENEMASPPEGGRGPNDGDFSMCFSCGEWAIFDSKHPGGMHKPVFEEYLRIVMDPLSRRMRDAWVAWGKTVGKP